MEPSQNNPSAADKQADRPNQKKYRRYKAKQTGLKEPGEQSGHANAGYCNIVDNDNETTIEELQLNHEL